MSSTVVDASRTDDSLSPGIYQVRPGFCVEWHRDKDTLVLQGWYAPESVQKTNKETRMVPVKLQPGEVLDAGVKVLTTSMGKYRMEKRTVDVLDTSKHLVPGDTLEVVHVGEWGALVVSRLRNMAIELRGIGKATTLAEGLEKV